jgi:hypothetical protein
MDMSATSATVQKASGLLVVFLMTFQVAVAGAAEPTSGGGPSTRGGSDYHVGPGQRYVNIGDVPWYRLQPGDTVYIHHRSTPYREKLLISTAGTASRWIRVLGVPGPKGELPVVSGDGATTSANMHYHWDDPAKFQAFGVIELAVQSGEWPPLPAYIEIANLQVQDGYLTYQFTAENGDKLNYDDFAACIYARSVKHLVVRDSVLTNCGLGFVNWTGAEEEGEWWNALEADTVLRGNSFYNNGVPGQYFQHQTYTESDGVVIEHNRYGPQRPGSGGSQLKDRSAGTVIRYNHFEQSEGGWDLDLVEPENGWESLGSSPRYRQAFVYGNVFVNRNRAPNFFHWNEDHSLDHGRAAQPSGKLFFYHNTIVVVADRADAQAFTLFNVHRGGYECPAGPLPGRIDVRNNIFAVLPRTAGQPLPELRFGYCGVENFDFGSNWVSPGYRLWTRGRASATGTDNLVSPAGNDPGFLSVSGNDFRLAPRSSAGGIGGPLAPEVTSNLLGLDLTPEKQHVPDRRVQPRAANGKGSDLGAFEIR